MSSEKERKGPAVESFANFLDAAHARVSVALPDLAESYDHIEHAQAYLNDIIDTEIRRQNFTSWDDASEKSSLLCSLMFVSNLLDDARFPLESYIELGLDAAK